MTPEEVQYHWSMLRLGQQDAYQRELDRILEEEDPLSPLTLELAGCMSDVNRTLSILQGFLREHPADQQQVYDLIMDDLRGQYLAGAITAEALAPLLWWITELVEDPTEEPWVNLYRLADGYDVMEAGLITREEFHQIFDARFLRDEDLDIRQLRAGKKTSIFDFFRKQS